MTDQNDARVDDGGQMWIEDGRASSDEKQRLRHLEGDENTDDAHSNERFDVGNEEQGLLSSTDKETWSDSDDLSEAERHTKHQWPRFFSSWLCCGIMTSIAGVLLLSAIFYAGSFFYLDHTQEFSKLTGAKSSGDKYLLDSQWEYSRAPQRRKYQFVLKDEILNPDGVYRPMMTINGEFPGPLIEVNEGDTLVVEVHNQLVNATSIHWHGIFQNGTNHMDGTVGVTQCPIAPGGNFTYKFTIRGQSGTYFYHAHQGVQAADGIVGPLVVHSKDEYELQKLQYDTDRVIMISDHYHDTSSDLVMTYLASDRENVEPVPDGALINGVNIRDCDALQNRRCDNSTARRPVLDLPPNQRHRLRFINTGAFAEFQVQIDEHEFAVTEVDGTDVIPAYYHRLNISPAQRYSMIVETNVTTADSFWLRARMVTHCFGEKNANQEPEIRAVINYANTFTDEQSLPESKDWSETIEVLCKDMNTTELIPSLPIAAPSKADHFFYIRSNFEIGAWRLSRGFFNTSQWRPDVYSPSLSRTIEGFSMHNESFELSSESHGAAVNDRAFSLDRELVIQTTGIQTIDLLIQNFDDGSHPMHLHGYKYFVLASGHGGFDADAIYPSLDLSNPLRRDTALVESYGWLLIRLVADNPGMWALHCHISWHSEAGLVMQLLTRSDVVAGWEELAANAALCRAQGLESGMAPPDEHFYGDE